MAKQKLADPGATVSVPTITEATRSVAVAGVRRRCPDADLILDVLGLLPPSTKRSAWSFPCPTCAAAVGTPCRDSNTTAMGRRCHVARNKALRMSLKEDDHG